MKRCSHVISIVMLFLAIAVHELHATGALWVRPLASTQTYQAMSIRRYDATVTIQDQIAVTHVDQTFFNKTSQRVESTFIFPLPEGAVITELIYWFNGKEYRASLRERKEAQQAYNERIRRLIDPALLQHFGDNVFKLNIAPIDPQSEVRFEITYAEILPYEFGTIEYRFPLVTTGLSPDPLDRVSVQVNATTAKIFKSFTSPSHGSTAASQIVQVSPSHYTVTFGDEHFTPDRDLVIRFDTRRDGVDLNVLAYVPTPLDSLGVDGFYALWITPPDGDESTSAPRDIVFTADISSSMEGERIEQLKQALNHFLDALAPHDRFNIVLFSTNAVTFNDDLVPASEEEIARARSFVNEVGALGLTNIDLALKRSLAMSFGDTTANIVVFLTDGYPTWGEIDLRKIADSAHARNDAGVRLFPFGIGDEVSRSLLDELARVNGGYATYITADDSIALVIGDYFRRVSLPVLSGLRLDLGGLQAYDRYPAELPDLFYGGQSLQFGRYRDGGTYPVTLTGTRGRAPFILRTDALFPTGAGGVRAVARLWAKRKIDDLLAQIKLYGEKEELVKAVIDLSIRFGILTPYTALYSDPVVDPPNTTGVPDDERLLPVRLTLMPCRPNPFAGQTRVRFFIPASLNGSRATVKVYDAFGRLVRVLFDRAAEPAEHEVVWDGHDDAGTPLPAGAYYLRLEAGGASSTTGVVLLR